jgi:hypothetical protein
MLAFGIGATTAIFSVVDGVLLRPLPFPQANQLVTLGDQASGRIMGKRDPGWVSAREVVTYQREQTSFSSLGGFGFEHLNLSGVGQPAAIIATRMTPSVFAALGVTPLMGRVFTKQEDTQHEQVVVLSYGTWKSRLNGNPNVLGTKILLDRKPYVVIGVMPRDFTFPLVARKAEIVFWIEQGWLQASIACRGKRRSYTITPEALMSLYKQHHADVLKRGIPNHALFEAYVQYCFSPKHTVGEQLLDVRRDKRERAAYAAAVGDEKSGDEEEEVGYEDDQNDDQRYGFARAE